MSWAVRAPASSANLGCGFDVLGMAVDLDAVVGLGSAPAGAQQLDEHHPAHQPYRALGGRRDDLWLRTSIPMARGLGFSGAVRVAAAGLALHERGESLDGAARHEALRVAAEFEGHGDNAAASVFGGVVAYLGESLVAIPVGPRLADAAVIAWVPPVMTSTDQSRKALPGEVARADAVHNMARAIQFALAVERDEPVLLREAVDDRLHQPYRLPLVPGAEAAIRGGVMAGAWAGWLSGSGPTVVLLAPGHAVEAVTAALPPDGHVKVRAIDRAGMQVVRG